MSDVLRSALEQIERLPFIGERWELAKGIARDALSAKTAERGWPEIEQIGYTSHSPIDTYRCENLDCPLEWSVWQFRPDDYDLDEDVVNCPGCGVEGELQHRWFRFPAASLVGEGNEQ